MSLRRRNRRGALVIELIGILNVTPDSFSDGGRHDELRSAVRAGREFAAAGAWAVDVGGESTRPGAEPVPTVVELARVVPVVTALAAWGVRVSVDTMKAPVAAAALEAGASIVNDVSGGRHDPAILDVVAASGATYVASHWRGPSSVMAHFATYHDVVQEVVHELSAAVSTALAAGVQRKQVVVDPGIGFAKNAEHNWRLLGHLDELCALGYPVLVGTSRKRFLSSAVPEAGTPDQRDDLTAVTSALAALGGATYARVHDVTASRRAVAVARAWQCFRRPR